MPKGTRANGVTQGAPPEFVIFLHVLSSGTSTRRKVLGPLLADHQVVTLALVGVFLHPFLFRLRLPSFVVLGALVGNWGAVNASSEP